MKIEHEIDLPLSPPVEVIGRGRDGQAVCKLYINVAGISIHGPRGGLIRDLNWDDLVALASRQ
jgi:hypothetical protein